MKSVLISVNKPNTDNIHKRIKTSELRTKPPKTSPPFKVYMYETLKGGGCGQVVSEWECTDIKEWRMCMGVPAHLSKVACVSDEYIWRYCNNGEKNIGEMIISNLIIYDKPKKLSEFSKYGFDHPVQLKKPPQSWCYITKL